MVMCTSIVGLIIYIFSRPQGNLMRCAQCGNSQTSGEREMSALRKSLKHPGTYIGILVALGILLCVDSASAPRQINSPRAPISPPFIPINTSAAKGRYGTMPEMPLHAHVFALLPKKPCSATESQKG